MVLTVFLCTVLMVMAGMRNQEVCGGRLFLNGMLTPWLGLVVQIQ